MLQQFIEGTTQHKTTSFSLQYFARISMKLYSSAQFYQLRSVKVLRSENGVMYCGSW